MKRRIFLALIPAALTSAIFSEETYEERMSRLDRERQAQHDLEDYMERWRANKARFQFSAIASSTSTWKWAYSWGRESQAAAEKDAVRRCGAPDAKALCWAKGGWYCALADGPKSFGAASAATAQEAKTKALKFAGDVAPGAKIVLCFGG